MDQHQRQRKVSKKRTSPKCINTTNESSDNTIRRCLLWSVTVACIVFMMIIIFMSFRSTPPTVFNNDEVIRIVMVGKTGVGKSATGNTILGQKCFKSGFSPKSLTQHCEKAVGEVDGQSIAVVDTPGRFYTRNTKKETVKDIAQCISYVSPGPHIFLVVIKLGRFTEEEKQTVKKIQKIFGEEANKYSMVLFTHGDQLKGRPVEEFFKNSEELNELVDKCNGQYHVFNNKEMEDRSQVRKLLEKIRKIIVQNGGSYYTTEMFQKAERAIEEEKQQILKEKEEQHRKEEEERIKKIEEKYEQLKREERAKRERENEFRNVKEKWRKK